MATYSSTLGQPPSRSFIAYIFSSDNSLVFNAQTSQVVQNTLSDLIGESRAPFRVSYTERVPGTYFAEVSLSNFPEGEYRLEAREILNGVEYSNVVVKSFKVSAGTLTSDPIKINIAYPPTRSIFAYIEDASGTQYLDKIDFIFKQISLLTSSSADRNLFRHQYTEVSSGEYSLTLDLSGFPNGFYTVNTYELSGDLEIQAGSDYSFRVQDGKQLSGIDLGKVNLFEDTGGKDSLRYLEANGNPVDAASVTVYTSSSYNSGDFSSPLGKTLTRSDGRWETPISVDSGTSYAIVFFKEGHFGPDKKEVVV